MTLQPSHHSSELAKVVGLYPLLLLLGWVQYLQHRLIKTTLMLHRRLPFASIVLLLPPEIRQRYGHYFL